MTLDVEPKRRCAANAIAAERVLHTQTVVQPGGRIEIVDPELPEGEPVDVVVSTTPTGTRRSAWQVITGRRGRRLFRSAEEVDSYLAAERDSWRS